MTHHQTHEENENELAERKHEQTLEKTKIILPHNMIRLKVIFMIRSAMAKSII